MLLRLWYSFALWLIGTRREWYIWHPAPGTDIDDAIRHALRMGFCGFLWNSRFVIYLSPHEGFNAVWERWHSIVALRTDAARPTSCATGSSG